MRADRTCTASAWAISTGQGMITYSYTEKDRKKDETKGYWQTAEGEMDSTDRARSSST